MLHLMDRVTRIQSAKGVVAALAHFRMKVLQMSLLWQLNSAGMLAFVPLRFLSLP